MDPWSIVRVFEALGYDADLAYYKAGQLPPDVQDILSATSTRPHTLIRFAHVEGTTITYPPEGDEAQPTLPGL